MVVEAYIKFKECKGSFQIFLRLTAEVNLVFHFKNKVELVFCHWYLLLVGCCSMGQVRGRGEDEVSSEDSCGNSSGHFLFF